VKASRNLRVIDRGTSQDETPGQSAPVDDSDDLIGVSGDGGVLLPGLQVVDAVCRSMTLVEFRMFKRTKYVFRFGVVQPPEHLGVNLQMFARFVPSWKRIPTSSKLYRCACVAVGRRLRGERITKSMFVGKLFQCRLKTVGDVAAYTIVDTLLRKLTSADH
jgi:hypothetical protein